LNIKKGSWQCLRNSLNDVLNIIHHIVIPKTQYPKTLTFQKNRSHRIVLHLIGMLTAIQFNYNFPSGSTKINYIWSNGVLAPKSCRFQPMGT